MRVISHEGDRPPHMPASPVRFSGATFGMRVCMMLRSIIVLRAWLWWWVSSRLRAHIDTWYVCFTGVISCTDVCLVFIPFNLRQQENASINPTGHWRNEKHPYADADEGKSMDLSANLNRCQRECACFNRRAIFFDLLRSDCWPGETRDNLVDESSSHLHI
jgi:hypothetical protein